MSFLLFWEFFLIFFGGEESGEGCLGENVNCTFIRALITGESGHWVCDLGSKKINKNELSLSVVLIRVGMFSVLCYFNHFNKMGWGGGNLPSKRQLHVAGWPLTLKCSLNS